MVIILGVEWAGRMVRVRLAGAGHEAAEAVGYASDRAFSTCRLRQRQDFEPVGYASDIAYWGRWRR
jgi:hypothetical protein